MARYNVHKRATLDRVTAKYHARLRRLFKEKMENMDGEIMRAIDDGERSFNPLRFESELEPEIYKILKEHQLTVIRVGFSDGIQEVSPEGKLSAWENFPLHMPIEDTLHVALASKRDSFVSDYIRGKRKTLAQRLAAYVKDVNDTYLKNIRKAYARAAKSWLDGDSESNSDIVRKSLKIAFNSTDAYSELVVRTETTNYFNQSRYNYFNTRTQVDYIQLYAVTDGRISNICESRHGYVVEIGKAWLKKYMPAFHPHCRTIQRPLFSSLPSNKVQIDKGLEMDERSFVPLPKGWAA